MTIRYRFLAQQFARPSGRVGRWLIGPWLNRIARHMNRLALKEMDLRPGENVLEVGFGGGGLLRSILASAPGEVMAVDVSEVMVGRAQRRFRRRPRLHIHHGSVEDLPVPDGAVDKAVSVNNIYFWPDPAAAMAELARVVRPGGRLVICFEPAEEMRRWPGHRFGFRLWRGEAVARYMRRSGFGQIHAVWGSGRRPDRFLCLSGTRLGAERDA